MKMGDNLELDKSDLERILTAHLASYRFYNKGRTPDKIIIPKLAVVHMQTEKFPPQFVDIPVVYFGEKGVEDDTVNRPQRVRRAYKVGESSSPSVSVEPQSDEP